MSESIHAKASTWRGHPITRDGSVYRYDDGTQVAKDPSRPCGRCGRANTSEDHDACLGTLRGVRNACCGHGAESAAFVQFETGSSLYGKEALAWFGEAVGSGAPPPPRVARQHELHEAT